MQLVKLLISIKVDHLDITKIFNRKEKHFFSFAFAYLN